MSLLVGKHLGAMSDFRSHDAVSEENALSGNHAMLFGDIQTFRSNTWPVSSDRRLLHMFLAWFTLRS
jgi:hypothetical protein